MDKKKYMKTEFRYLDSYTFKHNSKKNTGSKSTSPRPANGYGTVRRYTPIKKMEKTCRKKRHYISVLTVLCNI